MRLKQTTFDQYKNITHRTDGFRVVLGMTEDGQALSTWIEKAPQVLVAGTTGSGKSNLLHVMICSVLAENPLNNEMILIDPKHGAEFSIYDGIKSVHVIDNSDDAMAALEWATRLIEARFQKFSEIGVNDLDSYNQQSGYYLHPVMIVIDELADLMMTSKKETQNYIVRIGQLGRAAGVHMVVATQTPRREVVSGMIKANLPCKIALSVSSSLESRIILDQSGAENLLGQGDALISKGGRPIHFQAPYISREMIKQVVAETKAAQEAQPEEVVVEYDIPSLAERRKARYAQQQEDQKSKFTMSLKKYKYCKEQIERAKSQLFWMRI